MNNKSFQQKMAVLSYAFGNNTQIARHIGIDARSFRKLRQHIQTISETSRSRLRLGYRSAFLRLLIRELRESGALTQDSLRDAIKRLNDRIKGSDA